LLSSQELKNLEGHVVGIIQSVILPEIRPDGSILVADENGNAGSDQVTTHHLVDLCHALDPLLTNDIAVSACDWFSKQGESLQNPFFVTTLAQANAFSKDDARMIVRDVIRARQRPSGFIDIYAGFLDGGNIFSTLWAIKIINMLDRTSKSNKIIENAFDAIESHWDDVHRASFKGFYCELLDSTGLRDQRLKSYRSAMKEVLGEQEEVGSWDGEPLYTAYVTGNLAGLKDKPTPKRVRAIENGLRFLFDLSSNPDGIPTTLSEAKGRYVESAYLQACIRSVIAAVRYMKRFAKQDISTKMAASIFGAYPNVYQVAQLLNRELKHMNEQYGQIRSRFVHLEKSAEIILADSHYDKNVFVMMPFRAEYDERYETVEKVIRSVLAKAGFRAWLAKDKAVAPQLWDNVASYMLSCKYGIAVFTRVEKEKSIEEEFNPNVSLELGFCLSRGKEVLILKDSALSGLSTDLVGHLYREFDLNLAGKQLPRLIRAWVKDIDKSEIPIKGKED